MISLMKKMKIVMLALFLLGISINISGCLEDFSLNSLTTENSDSEFVDSNIGKIKILKVDPTLLQFIKENISDSLLNIEKTLPAQMSGNIKLGNDYLGYCNLKFDNGVFDKEVKIKIFWNLKKGNFEVEFKPEGLIFNSPVTLEMFYKLAKLDGVDESKIKLFYYNPDKKLWEVIGGVAEISRKLFTCQINHFSRYALAHSE